MSSQIPSLHHDWIDPDAIEIVDILQRKGFTTYLVGGCVRDLLVGIHPKDFDIATDAQPKDVKKLIRQAYIIGKRFRLVLVRRGTRQFEVATFRKNYDEEEFPDGPPEGDNIFGTPEEDASRRDFTINSLFYDPFKEEMVDFNEGLNDIENRVIRMIGDPEERFIEDPIRILRAIRLSHKIGFSLEPEIRAAIPKTANTLPLSVLPRRREEILKFLRLKSPELAFREAFDLGVLEHLSPALNQVYQDADSARIFESYLHRCPRLVCDEESPLDLFSVIILAYLRATTHPEPEVPLNASRLLEDPNHSDFFKNQLGLFKYEQSLIARALQTSHTLEKTSDFQRKGKRRQMAVLKSESFPLALKIAQYDYLIPPHEIHFWLEVYQQALPEIEKEQKEREAQRKKARRPRRPRKAAQ